uniref:TANC1/2-like winged helix domain-containing protein n=1 Tax=Strigamia maritima TaxID=126957 RepID=T1JLI1_STRMM
MANDSFKVLDGVADNFIMLREIREIPGTLNGLYLWLCQRLFARKQFSRIQHILNAILVARKPLCEDELYMCVWTRNMQLSREEFHKRMHLMSKLLIDSSNNTKILFHHSFAEWLLDVKHCTQKYLCHASDGHAMIAMSCTLRASSLSPDEVSDFAFHLSKVSLQPPLLPFHLPLWLIQSGSAVEDSVLLAKSTPKEAKVLRLLVEAGARLALDSETGSTTACSTTTEASPEDELLEIAENLAQLDANQRTLLHNGAYEGNVQLVNALLPRGLNVEAVDRNGQTALNLAARQGHAEVVRALLKAKANPDHADNDGWTPLRSAAWGGHTEFSRTLISISCIRKLKPTCFSRFRKVAFSLVGFRLVLQQFLNDLLELSWGFWLNQVKIKN